MIRLNRRQKLKRGVIVGGPAGGLDEIVICIRRFILTNNYMPVEKRNYLTQISSMLF